MYSTYYEYTFGSSTVMWNVVARKYTLVNVNTQGLYMYVNIGLKENSEIFDIVVNLFTQSTVYT